MRFAMTLATAAALSVSGFVAQAGGLDPVVMDPPPVIVDQPPAQGSSINSTYVIVGVLAALLIAAAVNANDN